MSEQNQMKEEFATKVLPNSYNEISLEKVEGKFFVIRGITKVSKQVKCEIFEEPIIEILAGNKAESGQSFVDNFNQIKLPKGMTAVDFQNLAKVYEATNKGLKENHASWQTKNSDVSGYIKKEDRKAKFEQIKLTTPQA